MTTDAEDLRQYARTGDEPSFRAIVERHAPMVHGVALRRTGDRELAEEVTQTVFVILAKKAGRLGHGHLAGWLHRAAFLVSRGIARKETKRRGALGELAGLADTMEEPPEIHSAWPEICQHLDEAMNQLPADDRQLMVLRYFEEQGYRQIATATGKTEEACRKKMQRALERLAGLLKRRGIRAPGTLLGTLLAAHALCPPPASAAAISAITASALQAAPAVHGGMGLLQKVMTPNAAHLTRTGALVLLVAGIPAVVWWSMPGKVGKGGAGLVSAPVASVAREVGIPSSRLRPSRVPKLPGGGIDWMELANKNLRDLGIEVAIREMLEPVPVAELAADLEKVTGMPLPIDIRGRLRGFLVEALADHDPRIPLARFDGDQALGLSDSLTGAFARLAELDVREAERWLDGKIAAGKFTPRALNGRNPEYAAYEARLIQNLAREDAVLAGERLLKMPAAQRGDVFLAYRSMDQARQLALLYQEATGSDDIVLAFLESETATENTPVALGLVDHVRDARERERLTRKFAANLKQ